MNVEQMQAEFVRAATDGVENYTAALSMTEGTLPVNVYGWSIGSLLDAVQDLAIELGQKYRGEILTAAHGAIDQLVAMDIPGIPALLEATIDAAAKDCAYKAVDALLVAILGPVALPA